MNQLTAKIEIEFTIDLKFLGDVLRSASQYIPPWWYVYDKVDEDGKPYEKSWVDCILDGGTVYMVQEDDLDTEMFWSHEGPNIDPKTKKPKITKDADILSLHLAKLNRGFSKWVQRYYERNDQMPELGIMDSIDCDALLQFACFGSIIIG